MVSHEINVKKNITKRKKKPPTPSIYSNNSSIQHISCTNINCTMCNNLNKSYDVILKEHENRILVRRRTFMSDERVEEIARRHVLERRIGY
jgi:hypothetical protein